MAKHTLQFMFFEGIHISFMGNDCVLIIGGGGEGEWRVRLSPLEVWPYELVILCKCDAKYIQQES